MLFTIIFVTGGRFVLGVAIAALAGGILGYAFRGKEHTAIQQVESKASGLAKKL